MKKNKTAVILLCAISIMIIISVIAFLIFSEPKRVLRRTIGIEPTERIVLLQKDRDIDGIWVEYSYELEFSADEYEEVLQMLCDFYGGEYKAQSGIEYEHSAIKRHVDGTKGFPIDKHWFDPQNNNIVWVHESPRYNVLVSTNSEGRYRAYIQYDWSPFGKMIH